MSEDSLFKAIYQLTMQLKGAPLRKDEKQELIEEFKEGYGSPFEKAISAITEVLHCKPSLIFEKGKALESVNKMVEDVKAEAEAMESISQHTQPF